MKNCSTNLPPAEEGHGQNNFLFVLWEKYLQWLYLRLFEREEKTFAHSVERNFPDQPKRELKEWKKLTNTGNAAAIHVLGGYYKSGTLLHGIPQNFAKANELWQR